MSNKGIVEFNGIQVPDSYNVECQLMAELVNAPENIPLAEGKLQRWMFANDKFSKVWDILRDMKSKGESIDLASVSGRVPKPTMMELISPRYGIGTGTPLSVTEHCDTLAQIATRRKLFLASFEMLKASADNSSDFSHLLLMPGKVAKDIVENSHFGGHTQKIAEVLNNVANDIQRMQERKNGDRALRVSTGFQFLDYLILGGFDAGQLIVLSARPSVGKTAMMLQFAKVASRGGFPTTIFTLEMKNKLLAHRLMFSTGKVSPGQIATGNVEWRDVEMANREIAGLPLYLNDKSRNLDELVAQITTEHQRGRCDIAFIDYLDKIKIPHRDRYSNPTQDIAEMTSALKQVAQDCDIPVVLLCQLNRASELDHRSPELVDLRNSGAIEQDADIVLMLERATRNRDDHNVNMWVRKNRFGRAGEVCVELVGNETFTVFTPR